MPPRSSAGYEALPALDEEHEDALNDLSDHAAASSSRRRSHQRTRSGTLSIANLNELDVQFKKWTQAVARRFAKGKGRAGVDYENPYEVLVSAFGPVEPRKTRSKEEPVKTLDHKPPLSHAGFLAVVEQIKAAIGQGVHPRLNRAGTSGSYFAKVPSGRTVGIAKPRDEEPYGSLNPKWSKWAHRHFLSPFFGFGRACLVPNFSYLSEAGASLLSDRLELYIVPPTELVSLSSPAFYYSWADRRAYKQKKRALPEKIGSLQLFVDGYKDASDFLKEDPWPGRVARDTLELYRDASGRRKKQRNWTRTCRLLCGRAGVDDEDSDAEEEDDTGYGRSPRLSVEDGPENPEEEPFQWTQELMDDFRLELEKLVILDVLMRNTDRGLDNFMVKVCRGPCRRASSTSLKQDKESSTLPRTEQPKAREGLSYLRPDAGSAASEPWDAWPHIHIAAIDNSLSFPIHHPNSWRSYCYGWLFLPSSLIGLPFSTSTREHFLPLLTDPAWWQQTVAELYKLFSIDEGFSERMFRRQIGVMKGQAWNIVKSLRNAEEGPLELCRRRTCLVHDEELVVADDEVTAEMIRQTLSVPVTEPARNDDDQTAYRPGMARNLSTGAGPVRTSPQGLSASLSALSPPRFHRHASDSGHGIERSASPLPTSKHVDLSRPVYGSASGVSMMTYMERLQRKEGASSAVPLEDDEASGYGSTGFNHSRSRLDRQGVSLDLDREHLLAAPTPLRGSTSMEGRSRSGSIDEVSRRREANVSSQSQPAERDRRASRAPLSHDTKTVIVERLEYVDARPFFAKF